MDFNILHLNTEGGKHTKLVVELVEKRIPDIICFADITLTDTELIASRFGYTYVFAPLVTVEELGSIRQPGSAILSKYPFVETQKIYYNDKGSYDPTVYTMPETVTASGERPEKRFQYNYTLLTVRLNLGVGKIVQIATTHFPVTDHSSPGLGDHVVRSMQTIDDAEHSAEYIQRLTQVLGSLKGPLIFTADLNSPRGEYAYDLLAHELVDQVPSSLVSSLDPIFHCRKDLKLMVDTIMTSPDLSATSFEVFDAVSDHKAFLASFRL